MFWKKTKTEPVINLSTWENDLSFLYLIMERKKRLLKTFIIDVMDEVLTQTHSFKDDEILEEIENTVSEVYDTLSLNYIRTLTFKYFKDDERLIEFISEDVYMFVIEEVMAKNLEKAKKVFSENLMRQFNLKV